MAKYFKSDGWKSKSDGYNYCKSYGWNSKRDGWLSTVRVMAGQVREMGGLVL